MTKDEKIPKEENIPENQDSKAKELTETLQRLQAEFENYKKRAEKEVQQNLEYANKRLLLDLLPIIDSFELALKQFEEENKTYEGIKLIYGQLFSVLESYGIKKIDAVGKKFDPIFHEALMKDCLDDQDEDIVIKEFQTGYMLKNNLIRTSKVMVNCNK